ncbi:MAG: hemerythrin domain-containing protein [Alphaproteobacteria bacterium]|nr:hemerythrin domain-containing protein [Alphaproteobacteria bacterium]
MAKASGMNAIELLKADHRKVEELFEKFEKARGAKADIAKKICHELIVHAILEEEIFYPSLRGKVEDSLLDESYVEHDGAKMLIAEILAGSPDDDFYDAKVSVLSEEIKHHVKEEEKRGEGLFAQARAAGVDLDALGAEIAARKEAVQPEVEADAAGMIETRTIQGAPPAKGTPPVYQEATLR